ncbi:MAG: transglutaminase domain-containing protein [Gammaproteobacteria bacterium]|nr:transglutaminase domain-containing protein [Gammaproteobacteria bacterium]
MDDSAPAEREAPRADPFALSPQTRSWIRDRVGADGSSGRRLNELAALFGPGGPLHLDYDLVSSQGAEATLEAGRGNCLSFTILFVALARELGLDARIQEVPVARTWSRVEDTVVSDRHVIASGRTPRGFWEVDFGRLTRPSGEPREPLPDRVVAAMLESNRGAAALSRGDSAEALARLRRSAGMAPELEQSWVNLGVALGRVGAPADAELAFRTALVQQPGEPSALSGLMRLYRETGATDTADALEGGPAAVARAESLSPLQPGSAGGAGRGPGACPGPVRPGRARPTRGALVPYRADPGESGIRRPGRRPGRAPAGPGPGSRIPDELRRILAGGAARGRGERGRLGAAPAALDDSSGRVTGASATRRARRMRAKAGARRGRCKRSCTPVTKMVTSARGSEKVARGPRCRVPCRVLADVRREVPSRATAREMPAVDRGSESPESAHREASRLRSRFRAGRTERRCESLAAVLQTTTGESINVSKSHAQGHAGPVGTGRFRDRARSAFAAQEPIEEIVVTGSFIRGTPQDAALPVDVVNRQDLLDRAVRPSRR